MAKQNLRTPGPIPVPDWALEAASRQMINHRGPEFREILTRVSVNLKKAFVTQGDMAVLTSSGTGALEAAVVNVLSPGDKVLAVSIGAFGDRFAATAKTYGADVTKIDVELGRVADPDVVRKALQKDPAIKAVLVTHNETSTGVTNDLEPLAKVIKGEFNKLLVVDAVSSVGSIPLLTDAWQCDVVASASQKGWMTAPGIAPISMSAAAWEANKVAKMPRAYFDLLAAKRYLERGETPWTPAIPQFYQIDEALKRMIAEGMERIWDRHARIAKLTRDGVRGLGLTLFAKDERYYSNTVTAINVPAGIDAKALLETLRVKHNVVLAGGQASLEGKIFRIGHLGIVTEEEIQGVLQALRSTLQELGFSAARSAAR